MTAFLIKGPKILIRVAILIIDYFKERIIKANSFEDLYAFLNVGLKPEITQNIL